MPTITLIEQQQRDPERVNVYLDGRFAFGASRLVVAARRLSVGTSLDDAAVQELRADDNVERAYSSALNFLSYRPRSRREVQDYLRKRDVDEPAIDRVVERLLGNGLLNDDEFARFWLENRRTFRPRGERALRTELWQKGVERDVVDRALEDLGGEEEAALAAARQKLRSYAGLDDREFARKMTAHLQRRGFSYSIAAATVRGLLQERGGDVDYDLSSD